MRKEILVTGGAGYIGSHTVVTLIENGFSPVIVDNFSNTSREVLSGIESITGVMPLVYEIDVANYKQLQKVFDHHSFEGVIHFAAYKSVGESVQRPLHYYQNNLNSLLTLLQLCESNKVVNIIFSSSCTLYVDPPFNQAVTEETPIDFGDSPYAATKRMGEKILSDVTAASKHLKVVKLRYFNPIGAHPSGEIGELPQGIPNNLLPYITQTAAGIRETLIVFGNDYDTDDGTCIRDYIHVLDVARAHVKALEWQLKQSERMVEAFNLGTGRGLSVLEVIQLFEKMNKIKLNWTFGKRRSGDRERIFANPLKAREKLGWSCRYSVAEAILHAWKWEQNLRQSQNITSSLNKSVA